MAGGVIPAARRNGTYAGVSAVADWMATFAEAAGLPLPLVDHTAAAAGLPPIDSLSHWKALTSTAAHAGGAASSPRAGKPLMISSNWSDPGIGGGGVQVPQSAVLLLDEWKLLVGGSLCDAWSGADSPNATSTGVCTKGGSPFICAAKGCLFDVVNDVGEHHDVAAAQPEVLHQMRQALMAEEAAVFHPDRGCDDHSCYKDACAAAIAAGGYWAPYRP